MRGFAVTPCNCGRLRVIDLSSETSGCPYCGRTVNHSVVKKLYVDEDQSTVRSALVQLTGFEMPEESPEVKKRIEEADPFSTLVYRYEECPDVGLKMEILAEGLTELYGTFTLEDVKRVDDKDGEKILRGMITQCIVFEPEPGRYKV